MSYKPHPIDTSRQRLPADLAALIERLAEHAHDIWAQRRFSEGWTVGPRDDQAKTNPSLVPYADLPESEKAYDRDMVRQTILAALALGFRIEPPDR